MKHHICAIMLALSIPGSALHAAEDDDLTPDAELMRLIDSKDVNARLRGIQMLANIARAGAKQKQGLRVLILALRDESLSVRCAAVDAMGDLGAAAEPAVPALVALMSDGAMRRRMLDAFRKMGTASKRALHTVADAFDDLTAGEKSVAIAIFKTYGNEARPAIPLLLAVIAREANLQLAAMDAMQAIAPNDEKFIAAMVAALKAENVYARARAAYILGRAGHAAAIEPLFNLAIIEGGELERAADAAVRALAKIGDPAVLMLSKTLREEGAYRRERSAIVLAKMAETAQQPPLPAIPVLIESLGDDEELGVRLAALRALRAIVENAKYVPDPETPDYAQIKEARKMTRAKIDAALEAITSASQNPKQKSEVRDAARGIINALPQE